MSTAYRPSRTGTQSERERAPLAEEGRPGGPRAGAAWRHAFARVACSALTALFLQACAMEGDFGRPRNFSILGFPLDAAYWTSDSTHRLSRFSGARKHTLTADEIELRDTAYRLRVQPHNLIPIKLSYSPQTAYAGDLARQHYKYAPARMAAIDAEIQADHQSLTLFAAAARRVLAADRARLQALSENRPYLTTGDARKARNRIRSNFAFIEGTFADIEKRISAYQYAIDRTRIETPGANPAAVEAALNHLRDRAAALHYELSRLYDVAARHLHNTPEPPDAGGRHAYGGEPTRISPRNRHGGFPPQDRNPFK